MFQLLLLSCSTEPEDCAGVEGGTAYLDECGGCDANVNNDGFTNVMDVVIMVNYVIGNIDFTSEQIESGDVNGDGFVDILDVVAIINYIVEGVPLGDG